jgi:hypothetical protein
MDKTSPEDRQLAIDVMAQTLADNGLPDDEAEELATKFIDGAIEQRDS